MLKSQEARLALIDRILRTRNTLRPRSHGLVVAAAALASALACDWAGTGPILRPRAALLVQPIWANPLSAGAPVARARVTARYLDGSFAAETIAVYPAGGDSLALNMKVPLTSAINGRQDFIVTFKLINAIGDTLFSGGPITVTAVTAGTPSAGAVTCRSCTRARGVPPSS